MPLARWRHRRLPPSASLPKSHKPLVLFLLRFLLRFLLCPHPSSFLLLPPPPNLLLPAIPSLVVSCLSPSDKPAYHPCQLPFLAGHPASAVAMGLWYIHCLLELGHRSCCRAYPNFCIQSCPGRDKRVFGRGFLLAGKSAQQSDRGEARARARV